MLPVPPAIPALLVPPVERRPFRPMHTRATVVLNSGTGAVVEYRPEPRSGEFMDNTSRRPGARFVVVIALLALVAGACGGDELDVGAPETPVCAAGGIDGDLAFTLFNWPEYLPAELIEQFERLYGVTVEQRFYESNESMLSQVQARAAPFDLIVPSDYMVDIMRRDGLLLPLDPIALPGRINLDPLFDRRPFDPDGNYSVPYLWGTVGIGVNVNVVGHSTAPTWGLLFDPDQADHFAGRISLLDDPRQAMAAALIYLGYSPNTRTRDQIVEAADLIAVAAPNLAGFESIDYAGDLADGALDVAQGRSDVFFDAFGSRSTDYQYLIPAEGAIAWVDNMAIPITAEHPCTAHSFIDFILEAKNAASLANFTGYASPNMPAAEFIDLEQLTNPAIYPPPEARETFHFLVDLGDLEVVYLEEFVRALGRP